MSVEPLLTALRQRGVHLWREGDRVRYKAAAEALPPEMLAELRARKTEISDYLRQTAGVIPEGNGASSASAPLSFSQERLWFLDKLEPSSPTYNIPVAVRLSGALDEGALRRAFDVILERHESLRTNIETVNGMPVQCIRPAAPLELPVVDLTGLPGDQREAEAYRLAAAEAAQPFNLAHDCLLRARLYRFSETEHLLVVKMHHIASDGWSLGILFRELAVIYDAAAHDRPAPLPELPLPYAEFGVRQREWLRGEVLEREMDFWRRRLANVPALLDLPTDRPRPPVQTNHGHTVEEVFPGKLVSGLEELSRGEGATLFMTLLAAFQTLLHRYARQDDILVGSPVACRNRPELEGLIGLFVNTVVLRADLSGNPPFRKFLSQVRETTLEALAHQELPFEKLVEELHPVRNLAHSPVFQVAFVANNSQLTALALNGMTMTPVTIATRTAKYDLTLFWEVTAAGLVVRLEYNTDLFDATTMRRLLGHYQMLLAGIVAQPDEPVQTLPLLTPAEREQVLVDWNATARDYPWQACLHELVEAQVQRTPDAVAAVCGDESLTYRDLNERADRLARHLSGCGVAPGRIVGIYVERSLDMLVGLVGILKAGGAYLPLDPNFPAERLAFMLGDAQPAVLLTQQRLADVLPAHDAQVVFIDALPAEGPALVELMRPQATDLVYVLYTSGSTGKPKGVQISHRGFVNFLISMQRDPGFTAADVWLALATLSFDIAGLELFLPLLTGARVVIASRAVAIDGVQLARLVTEARVTVLQATPITWRMLLAAGWTGNPQLKILCGAEALPVDLAEQLLRCTPEVWNLYGPTETTVWSALGRVLPGQPITVGRPIANMEYYVVDQHLQPVPVGVPGELLIGGDGVGRGYLNRAELTAAKFIPNPFRPGERVYRTGDLVRYRVDGSIDFLGRLDHQVKIRGFRIELGEIESTLGLHPDVTQTVVVAREDVPGEKRLVAYLTWKGTAELVASELRAYLKERLPDYMVPAAFVRLETWPVTPTGKVDRKALPSPDGATVESGTPFVAPRDELERQLATAWETVFNRQSIGVRDNFFDLGGHSLLALRLFAEMEKLTRQTLPLVTLFQAPTIERLAGALRKHGGAAVPVVEPAVPNQPAPADPTTRPLSFAQERLWFLDQLEPNSATYNLPVGLWLTGAVNIPALQASLTEILRRHETLRASFTTQDGQPVQRIRPPGRWELPVEDLSAADNPAVAALESARLDARQPFVLAQDQLVRAKLYRLGATESLLMVLLHHIVSDGWSIDVFFQELNALYEAFRLEQPAVLPALPLQYAEYAVWQRQWLEGPAREQQLAYWRQRLANAPALLDLPTDRPRPAVQRFRGQTVSLVYPAELTAAVQELSSRASASLFMILLSAFETLLQRYSRQDDILIGTPMACRSRADVGSLIGLFVNTVVMRGDLSGNPTFRALLEQTRTATLEALANQELPFEKLVDDLQPARNLAHTPLVQVMFVANGSQQPLTQVGDLAALPVELATETAKFDLTLYWQLTPRGLGVTMEYNTDLFEAATIHRMLGQYQTLLEGIVANPDTRLADLPLLPAAELDQLAQWNATAVEYPTEVCLHQLFEAQVARTPNAVAVIFEEQQLTYRELDARANQLAAHLQSRGVTTEDFVGVYLERSVEMVVALYATLKAGAAYVPIDPTYPPDRVAFMLGDTNPRVLLTQERLVATLPAHQAQVVLVDREVPASTEGPVANVNAGNLAYMIYTSGSTGKPKGAMNTHRGIVNRLLWMQDAYRLGPADRVLQKTPFSFDVSVWEFFWPLLTGARLIVARPEGHRDSAYLTELINRHQITTLHFVPSMLAVFLTAENVGKCRSLRRVICSGEALGLELQETFFEKLPEVELHNLYGPTEAAVDVTYWACQRESGLRTVPIGRPIANIQMHILDAHLQPVPVGVAGELHIAGVGLGRGYHNRPELTAEKFIPNPFQPGTRLYKTGDLARYLPDGNIEYLGRLDHQVKIRGFRIELGEIEVALGQHPAVREAVVVAREDVPGDKRLVGYVVAPVDTPTISDLREYLKPKLPEYMVPAAFVFLPAMPLSPNGKVDRRLLPAPDQHRPELAKAFVAPSTPAEQTLAEIWAKVLRLERVGVHDKFFELGGDSILSIHVISKANQAGLKLTPKQIFQHQTIAELAAVAGTAVATVAEQGAVTGEVLLTPIQRWFFAENHTDPQHWNQAMYLDVSYSPAVIEGAVQRLVAHHDALRLRFEAGRQFHAPVSEPVKVRRFTGGAADYSRQAAELQASLDLAKGPVLRAGVFDLGDKRRVLLVIHHLVVDGVSWQILWEDFETLCRGGTLPAKTTSFQQWARRLTEYAECPAVRQELAFWRRDSEGRLPVDVAEGADTEGSTQTVTVALPAAETQALLQEAPRAYNTQINDLLLAALARALGRWTNRAEVVIDLEGHGREELFPELDVSRTVGWFTTLFPVIIRLEGDEAGAVVKSVKEQLRAIPERGIGYGVLRYLAGEAAAELKGLAQAEVLFNYLGQFDSAGARWEESASRSPRTQRTHALVINSLVSSGELRLDWDFSGNRYERETIAAVAADFLRELRGLIEHCGARTTRGATPADFPLAGLTQGELDGVLERHPDLEDVYRLSPMQQLFYSVAERGADIGFDQWSYELSGPVDAVALRQAWQTVLDRHALLRTVFDAAGPEPVQVVRRQVELPWAAYDWRGQEQTQAWEELLRADRQRGFALAEEPLLRLTLVRLEEERYRLVWSHHHVLVDGWSWPLILQEVAAVYAQPDVKLVPSRPYRDYIAWLQRQDLGAVEAYWRAALAGFRTPTALPAQTAEAGWTRTSLELSAEQTGRLQLMAREQQLTLNVLVQTAWGLWLSRYAGTADVVFGAAVSGRPPEVREVESMIGLFINNLPVRLRYERAQPVVGLLRAQQERLAELQNFEFTPLTQVQEWSEVPGYQRLFESLIVFQNYVAGESAEQWLGPQVTVRTLETPIQTGYPVTLVVQPGAKLTLELVYRTEALPAREVLEQVRTVLASLPEMLKEPVGDLVEQLPVRSALPATAAGGKKAEYVAPHDELERDLVKIWEKIFGITPIGVHDNFFHLGGHSIVAVRLFAQVQKLTGQNLPMVTLFQAPTIEQLAGVLRQQGWEAPWSCLVPIKASGTKPPFYCIHGVGGNILEYLDLAKYVTEEQPFYGIQAVGLDGKRPWLHSIEDQAAHHVKEIRAFQPVGPYYLGGSSYGGLVAYEMAQQLHQAGERVALLGLFDTTGPGYPEPLTTTSRLQQRLSFSRYRFELHWGNLCAASGWQKWVYLMEKLKRAGFRVVWNARRGHRLLKKRLEELTMPKAIAQTKKTNAKAATEYVLKPYPGKAVLFRAVEQPPGIKPDRLLGWGPYVLGGLEIYDTPGHHGAIVRDPRARKLTEQLLDALHKAQAEAKAP